MRIFLSSWVVSFINPGDGMKKNGFSLIELMVVMAIIAFLSVLAVPQFTRFLAKAKRTEAYVNLSALYAAQKAFYVEHGYYANSLYGPGSLGWRPEGYSGGGKNEKFYYTYGFSNGSEGTHYFTGKLETPQSNLSAARADKNSFVLVAAGDIVGNGKPDILSVDENNNIVIVQDGLQ